MAVLDHAVWFREDRVLGIANGAGLAYGRVVAAWKQGITDVDHGVAWNAQDMRNFRIPYALSIPGSVTSIDVAPPRRTEKSGSAGSRSA